MELSPVPSYTGSPAEYESAILILFLSPLPTPHIPQCHLRAPFKGGGREKTQAALVYPEKRKQQHCSTWHYRRLSCRSIMFSSLCQVFKEDVDKLERIQRGATKMLKCFECKGVEEKKREPKRTGYITPGGKKD